MTLFYLFSIIGNLTVSEYYVYLDIFIYLFIYFAETIQRLELEQQSE